MKKLTLEYIKEIEMHFAMKDFGNNLSRVTRKGKLHIMISAPHNVTQTSIII